MREWRDYYGHLANGQLDANEADPAGATLNDRRAWAQDWQTWSDLDDRFRELEAEDRTPRTYGHDGLEDLISGMILDTFDGHGVPNPSSPSPQDEDQSIGEFFTGLVEQLFPNANYQTINRNIEDPNNNSGGF